MNGWVYVLHLGSWEGWLDKNNNIYSNHYRFQVFLLPATGCLSDELGRNISNQEIWVYLHPYISMTIMIEVKQDVLSENIWTKDGWMIY